MAATTRQQLIEYCLRELGEPVVEINIDDSQIEDRVDEALEHWKQYHWDGVEKVYLKQQITASRITLTTSIAATYTLGETVTGLTSGATGVVTLEGTTASSGAVLLVKDVTGTFAVNETVRGSTSNVSGTLASIVLGTYDTEYFDLPDAVYGIARVLSYASASSSKDIFDIQYQLRLNDLYDLTSTSVIYYNTVMNHLALLDSELNGKPLFRFNRRQGRLFLDTQWSSVFVPGDWIVVDCYRALDPNTFTRVWDEPWLKHFTTALLKKQWASNGRKFNGLVLPGGVTIDWIGMYNEANDEIKALKDELLTDAQPLEWYVG